MANVQVAWEEVETRKPRSERDDKYIYLRGKYLPAQFIPGLQIVQYEYVYDEQKKKHRLPENGESSKVGYVFHALVMTPEGAKVKVAVAGPQVMDSIKSVVGAISAVGMWPVVKVTKTGEKLETNYKAEVVPAPAGKNITKAVWDKYADQVKAISLDDAVKQLTGEKVAYKENDNSDISTDDLGKF